MSESNSINSVETYEKKYREGWYPIYPEGDVIRIYEHFLKNKFSNNHQVSILDFGCGNGTTPLYFKSKGYDVYGIDVIPDAIEECKRRLPDEKNNFKLIEHGQNVENLFEQKFDIIFSRQVLYYLSDTDMENTLKQFSNMLKPNGFVYFTMMGTQNYYYKFAKPEKHDGLQEVTLTGRLNETSYINFINTEEELKEKFHIFEPVFIGSYDITLPEGSSFHYFFTGKKAS